MAIDENKNNGNTVMYRLPEKPVLLGFVKINKDRKRIERSCLLETNKQSASLSSTQHSK